MKKLIAMCLVLVPGFGLAEQYDIGGLVISDPVAFETAATAMSGAGYLTITNTGDTDDRLIRVDAGFPRVMIHETRTENGVATMVHLDGVDLPAGDTVAFAPGGKHIMFMGLAGDPLETGETFAATLTFEKAGTVEITFNVTARDGTPSH